MARICAYTGYNSDADASVAQLAQLNPLVLTANAVVQTADLTEESLLVSNRYLLLLVKNASGQALSGSAADHEIVVNLYTYEAQ